MQLGRNAVFASLSPRVRERLAEAGTLMMLERGARLFSRGDPGDAVYLLLAGELEVSLPQLEGDSVWLAQLGPGSLVGDMALLDGEVRSADVIAARRCRLLRLSRTPFITALEQEPTAAMRLLSFALQRLRATNARLEQTASLDVGSRLARFLLGEPQPNTRSQGEIAAMIGASRESVNRRLGRWRALKIIDVTRRGILILDAGRLQETSEAPGSRHPGTAWP